MSKILNLLRNFIFDNDLEQEFYVEYVFNSNVDFASQELIELCKKDFEILDYDYQIRYFKEFYDTEEYTKDLINESDEEDEY